MTTSRLNPKAAAEIVVSGIELQHGDLLVEADAKVISVVARADKVQVEIRNEHGLNDLMLDPRGRYKVRREKVEAAKSGLEVGDTVRFAYPGHTFEGKVGEIVDSDTKRTAAGVEKIYQIEGEGIDPEDADSWAKADELMKVEGMKAKATIKKESDGYHVYSESGKNLGGPYKTKEEADKRLAQVHYFKNKKAMRNDEDPFSDDWVRGQYEDIILFPPNHAESVDRQAGIAELAARIATKTGKEPDLKAAEKIWNRLVKEDGPAITAWKQGGPTLKLPDMPASERIAKKIPITNTEAAAEFDKLDARDVGGPVDYRDTNLWAGYSDYWILTPIDPETMKPSDKPLWKTKKPIVVDEYGEVHDGRHRLARMPEGKSIMAWLGLEEEDAKKYIPDMAATAKREPKDMDETYAEHGGARFFREGDKFYFIDEVDGKPKVKELNDAQADEVRAALADISAQGLGMGDDAKIEVVREAVKNLSTKKNRWADAAKKGEWVIKYDNGTEIGATKDGMEIKRVKTPSRKSPHGIEQGGIRYEVKMPNGTIYSAKSLQSAMDYADKEGITADASREAKMATRAELERTYGDTTRQIADKAVAVVAAVRRTYHGIHAAAVKPYTDTIGVKARQLYNETHATNWTTTDPGHIGTDAMKIRAEIDGLQRDIRAANLPIGLSRIFANHLLDSLRGLREAIDNL